MHATFINNYVAPSIAVVIVDPGRGLPARISKQMVGAGYAHGVGEQVEDGLLPEPFPRHIGPDLHSAGTAPTRA